MITNVCRDLKQNLIQVLGLMKREYSGNCLFQHEIPFDEMLQRNALIQYHQQYRPIQLYKPKQNLFIYHRDIYLHLYLCEIRLLSGANRLLLYGLIDYTDNNLYLFMTS